MDIVFIITTLISIATNVLQYLMNKRFYNIIFLHYSLVSCYDLSDFYEFTDLSKAIKMARHHNVIVIGSDYSNYNYDWIILPTEPSSYYHKILVKPSEQTIKGLLNE